MKPNVGNTDRILRALAGIALLGAGFAFQSWWGLVGLVPLATAAFARCPAYCPLGIDTTKRGDA